MANKYKYIKVGLASPEQIRSWSHGEVLNGETLNYRTQKPEPDGLFCEKIFGPTKDNTCYCGKTKRGGENSVCPYCGVELTSSKVRRERMGHIELNAPVVHTWFLKSALSPIGSLLNIKNKDLLDIVYYCKYIVIEPGTSKFAKNQVIDQREYEEACDNYYDDFEAKIGAEAILELLQNIDLKALEASLKLSMRSTNKQTRITATKRLEVVRAFLNSDNKPEWMILRALPVLPPDLRPMVPLDGGRFATTDINDLYRDIIMRNNRIKKFDIPLCAQNEMRLLQVAVDDLIDGTNKAKKASSTKRQKKSLTTILNGKQGRFRQNLLGKRVDYSGRSVIVIGPNLKMYQCGIPREMALILFEPFVMHKLMADTANSQNPITIKEAKKLCERKDDRVWKVLQEIVREHPVLLNRAPTLHRLGIQAFEPVLIDGKAIRLHPLVCTAFNADFDGDQMAVHVPLSLEAQAEARLLMLASNNILNPKDGKPVVTPSQDMVLGNYYLTLEKLGLPNEGHFFKDYSEAYIAYKNNVITLQTRIFVDPHYLPSTRFENVDIEGKYLFTTLGKMIFNDIMPDDFPYFNEPEVDGGFVNLNHGLPEKYLFDPKHDDINTFLNREPVKPFIKKTLGAIIGAVFKKHQVSETSAMLDRLKDLGFKYSTISGISISMADIILYDEKEEMVKKADAKVDETMRYYDLGWVTESERKEKVVSIWSKTRDEIQDGLWKSLAKDKGNAIFMMAESGSRGSASNFAQLAGMRGLMSNTSGEAIEIPVKANFREGLSVSEFFISTHGARKGSTDTALKTANSGYLTRKLVDVAQNIVITCEDCGTDRGLELQAIKDANDEKDILSLADRVIGRYAASDIVDDEGNVLCKRNELIDEAIASQIKAKKIKKVNVRTNLTCACTNGVCKKCYGRNLATNGIVEVGEAVGVVAAQSIGEPGTQLTMRTFHTGGVASTADITQGLPRVEEIFECRHPKGSTTLCRINGTVIDVQHLSNGDKICVQNDETGEVEEYTVDATADKLVRIGQKIKRGDSLTVGAIYPCELLEVTDLETTQKYIVDEIQKVYRSQSVEIADKHIEIIVRQMTSMVEVTDEGDTDLIPGRKISIEEFKEAVKQAIMNKKLILPKARPVIHSLVTSGVKSTSFLSAASFQQTRSVLTEAALKSKKDNLVGLKENVIIGGLIPAGTGVLQHTDIECPHRPVEEDPIDDIEIEEIIENDFEVENQEEITE